MKRSDGRLRIGNVDIPLCRARVWRGRLRRRDLCVAAPPGPKSRAFLSSRASALSKALTARGEPGGFLGLAGSGTDTSRRVNPFWEQAAATLGRVQAAEMIATLSEIISQIVLYTTIYALASLGIILSGRTGIFNIAGEGIMLFAASVSYMSALTTQSWVVGFLAGAAAGGLLGLALIFIHEQLKVDQFILGISIIILGSALADLLYKLWFGAQLMVQRAPEVPVIAIPLLSKIPLIRGFFRQNVITFFMYVSLFASYFLYYHTKKGLEIRAIGENPKSADVVGINVFKYRYLTTIIGAVFLGIGGAYLPMILTGSYSFELTAGRGYMAIGIAIFANWRPQRVLVSAFIFAAFEVLAPQLQIFFPALPYEFFLLLPFLAVLVIMAIFRRRIEFPAALGDPYSRE